MLWWIGSIAYAALALGPARLFAGHLAWSWRMSEWEFQRCEYPSLYGSAPLGHPKGEQWLGAWCLALAACLLWPLMIVPWLAGRQRAVGAEANARAHIAQQRVAELERELGIR